MQAIRQIQVDSVWYDEDTGEEIVVETATETHKGFYINGNVVADSAEEFVSEHTRLF
jgi:phage terminase large subunit-like protein